MCNSRQAPKTGCYACNKLTHNSRRACKIGSFSFYTHNYRGVVYIAKEQTIVITVDPSGHFIYPNPITYTLRSFCLRQEQGKKF